MADIFEQVDEALREERVRSLWKRYGWMIIAGAILIVVGTAAVVGWRSYERSVTEDNTLALVAAIEEASAAEPADAVNILTNFADGSEPNIAALARMRAAGSALEADDPAEAIALYQAVAGNADVDPALRDFATVLAASLSVGTVDLDSIQTQLAALDASNSPWRYMSNEIIAAAAIQAGNLDLARERLTAISDDSEAPIRLRGRATELLAAIGGNPDETAATETEGGDAVPDGEAVNEDQPDPADEVEQ